MITRFSLRSQVSRAQFSWRVCLATALSMALPLLPLKAAKPPLARTPAPAMVEHDCAPWDGPAFGLWIPAKDLGGPKDSWISIRIWQRPEASRGQFTFPERSPRQKGSAMLFLKLPSVAQSDQLAAATPSGIGREGSFHPDQRSWGCSG